MMVDHRFQPRDVAVPIGTTVTLVSKGHHAMAGMTGKVTVT